MILFYQPEVTHTLSQWTFRGTRDQLEGRVLLRRRER